MSFLKHPIKQILFLFVLLSLHSCKCQSNTKRSVEHSDNKQLGKVVSEIDDQIWNIYQDINGHYWYGSRDNGLYQYDGKNLRKYTSTDGLMDNSIRGIQGDSIGNIYIETPRGVSLYEGGSFTSLKPIRFQPDKWKLDTTDIWFNCMGNPHDVYRYDGESLYELGLPRQDLEKAFGVDTQGVGFKDMNNSPYAVYCIDKDTKGNIWFGTVTAGAFRYDGESFLWFGEKELSTLEDGRAPGVRSIIEDKEGSIWISNTINRYKVLSNTYEKLPGIPQLKGNVNMEFPYFLSSTLDPDNNSLWMVTYGSGVWNYDGQNLKNYLLKDEDTDVLLVSIFKDNEDNLWLGTDNAGVYKYNGKDFKKFTFSEERLD